MVEALNISWEEELKKLINEYKFNVETLSRYLSVSLDDLVNFVEGKDEKLEMGANSEFDLANKVLFLSLIPNENPLFKIKAFLEVLLDYHHLSKETISKMAGISEDEMEKFLNDPIGGVSDESKYKIASVTMSLRFFMKDIEP